MPYINRRGFIAGAATIIAASKVSAADKLTAGIMGLGGRGTSLTQMLCLRDDVNIKYLCDVDESKFARVAAEVDDLTGQVPKRITDFRVMLDDPEVDFIVVATPVHWHALATVLACQAGKHVYVEKPVSQSVWEGRKMVEAARKYKCVVQSGQQNRSGDYIYKAAEFIKSGALGKIHQCRIVEFINYGRQFPSIKPKPVPDGMNWDVFCGPAPLHPYTGTRVDRVMWDYCTGPIIDDGIHQLDVARWILGVTAPKAVHNSAGLYSGRANWEVPDTQVMVWEFDDMLMTLNGSTMTPYCKKAQFEFFKSHWGPNQIDENQFPEWMFNATRFEVYGTDAMMIFGRHGGGYQVYGKDGGLMLEQHGKLQLDTHIENFCDCIRTGKKPNGDIEEAVLSTNLAHIAHIAHRVGNRQLQWDGDKEQFINDDEANALVKREYRKPWVIPEKV